MGTGDDELGLGLGLIQLLLDGLLEGLLGLGPGLMDLFIRPVQLGLILCVDPLRLGQLLGRLLIQLAVVLLPLGDKPLHRLVEQDVQPAGQDGQIHPMQQDLLPINIQRHRSHLPYNTKIMRITTSNA